MFLNFYTPLRNEKDLKYMNVSTSYYLKTVHGGHKVVLENDKVLIAEKTLSFKDFKAVYGKNPLNYFEDKKNECKLKGLISIFDVIKAPINKAIDNIPRFIKKKLGIDVEAKYQETLLNLLCLLILY